MKPKRSLFTSPPLQSNYRITLLYDDSRPGSLFFLLGEHNFQLFGIVEGPITFVDVNAVGQFAFQKDLTGNFDLDTETLKIALDVFLRNRCLFERNGDFFTLLLP